MLSLRTAKPGDRRRGPPAAAGVVRDAERRLPPSPRDEHTAKPKDEEAEAVFRCLQRRNRVKLVEPIDEEDMYCAAISGTGCRLTALGRRY
jgi:hypothetical protein